MSPMSTNTAPDTRNTPNITINVEGTLATPVKIISPAKRETRVAAINANSTTTVKSLQSILEHFEVVLNDLAFLLGEVEQVVNRFVNLGFECFDVRLLDLSSVVVQSVE